MICVVNHLSGEVVFKTGRRDVGAPGHKNVRPPGTADGLETTRRARAGYSADASVTAAVPSEVALG